MNTTSAKRAALISATLASFLTPFMVSSVNIALPSIGREFSMNAVMLNWVATSYLLAAAMFLVPFGRLADIVGRKKIFTAGIIIYTLSSLLAGFSITPEMLILFRVVQGFGSAMVFGTGVAILTSVFPPNERGKVLGINVAAVYIGLSLGPFLGGLLTEYFGWRSIFFVNVPAGLTVIAFILAKLKGEWAEAKGEKFDIAGSFIYCVSLTVLMYGFSLLPGTNGIWLVLFGFAGLFVFIKWQGRVKSPLLNINLFRKNKVFAFSNIAALINYSATFAVSFLLSLYLQYTHGYSAREAGVILVAQPAVMAIFSPLAGRLSDKIEPRIIASVGMALACAGLSVFAFLTATSSITFILTGLIILGFGFALFSSPNTNAVMGAVEKKYYGIAAGTLGTMRLTGQMFSMGVVMIIFALFIGRTKISPANYSLFQDGVKTSFIVFAALCFVGIFFSLFRGKNKN
ncbi:MAG: MFS transporter [Bacteroidales bacterium]